MKKKTNMLIQEDLLIYERLIVNIPLWYVYPGIIRISGSTNYDNVQCTLCVTCSPNAQNIQLQHT